MKYLELFSQKFYLGENILIKAVPGATGENFRASNLCSGLNILDGPDAIFPNYNIISVKRLDQFNETIVSALAAGWPALDQWGRQGWVT